MTALSTDYYRKAIDLQDVASVEAQLQRLVDTPIESVADLEVFIQAELEFYQRVTEVIVGHMVDFYRDTTNEDKKSVFLHDQTQIQPLATAYQAKLDEKFCTCPFTSQLDEERYGLMKKARATSLELFREENIPLEVREQELVTEYNELTGGLTAEWDGQRVPLPVVEAKLDSTDRTVREQAWHTVRDAYNTIKPRANEIMDELVKLRHQIATNAGFENYRDYVFREKNREYGPADCMKFHQNVEKYIIPVWDEVAERLRERLGVDSYRPWDNSNCTISKPPYEETEELVNGVERMLRRTDAEFAEIYLDMLKNDLLDLGGRHGKAPGGFNAPLPVSKRSFVFANFSPSYFALIALVHEMGHAINGRYQAQRELAWHPMRMEVAELFSHGMELLCLDKLDEFYKDESDLESAFHERLRRSLGMLYGPIQGDLFQHWMYENPTHTAAQRDAKFREISNRFGGHPVDWSGLEEGRGSMWIQTGHYFASPFYYIEYAMAELGALQLLQRYHENPSEAVANYKNGAGTDYNQPISGVYEQTGVKFDFSEAAVKETGEFIRRLWDSVPTRG